MSRGYNIIGRIYRMEAATHPFGCVAALWGYIVLCLAMGLGLNKCILMSPD